MVSSLARRAADLPHLLTIRRSQASVCHCPIQIDRSTFVLGLEASERPHLDTRCVGLSIGRDGEAEAGGSTAEPGGEEGCYAIRIVCAEYPVICGAS